jgi:NADH-quinone oxidoreductase subunit G
MEEVAGTSEIGSFHRGNDTEVATFLNQNILSELSGNIIDLCPVGALTAKPYAFTYRSWELTKTPSIDVMDSLGSAIRVDSKGNKVVRILPRINEEINEEWLSDRSRFSCDALSVQRIDKPYIKKNGAFVPSSWEDAITIVAEKFSSSGERSCVIAGKFADAESIYAIKKLFNILHSNHTQINEDGAKILTNARENYILNTPISEFENLKTLLIVNSDVRYEAPLLNARILKAVKNGCKIFVIGEKFNANYKFTHIGNAKGLLSDVLAGNFPEIFSEKSAILVGRKALIEKDGYTVHKICLEIGKKMGENAFNLLHESASAVAGLDFGFINENGIEEIYEKVQKQEITTTFLLGSDDIDLEKIRKSFIIYQGTHADRAIKFADVILPSEAYTEKFASFINNEGKMQTTVKAVESPSEAKNDEEIICMIAKKMRISLPEFSHAVNPLSIQNATEIFGKFTIPRLESRFRTCSISRNSKTMLECEKQL